MDYNLSGWSLGFDLGFNTEFAVSTPDDRANTVYLENRASIINEDNRIITIKKTSSSIPASGSSVSTKPKFVFDNFNRAGPALGANWANGGVLFSGEFEIVGNQLQVEAAAVGSGTCVAGYIAQSFSPDMFAEVELYGLATMPDSFVSIMMSVRADGPDGLTNCYLARISIWPGTYSSVQARLIKFIGGTQYPGLIDGITGDAVVYTGINPADVVDGTTFRVEAFGTNINVYLGDVMIFAATDSDINGTSPNDGVYLYSYSDDSIDTQLDNFKAGDLT